jgi:phosphatidylglycerol:prolipoprotein diacylglycerol transferase
LVFLALLFIWRRPRKPGIVGGWFLMLYAVVRIFDEQFRRPDLHIQDQEFAMMGLTRGQLLSAVMLLAGIAYTALSARRSAARLGGWSAAAPPASADSPVSPGQ